MRVGQERKEILRGTWMKWLGTKETLAIQRIPLGKRKRMPGAYSICTEMFGSGVVIGTYLTIIARAPALTRLDPEQVRTECTGEAV